MKRTLAILCTAAALLGACGDDSEPSGEVSPTSAPQAGADDNDGTDGTAEAIISLSPTATEILFAIGAGDQVLAVDDQSDYPPEAPTTDLSGFQPNVEAVAAYEPDLVVFQAGTEDVVSGLDALGIETLVQPAAVTLDDTYDQIAELGMVTGREDEAAGLVGNMRTSIDELVAQVPDRPEPPTYYHELDPDLFSVTSQTFIGGIYELAGLENVADAASADAELPGYPQLSAEYLVEADPDFVFLADTSGGQTADSFGARPGFDVLSAVRNDRVVELDDDVASRWGPRVVEFLRRVVEATATVPVG